MAPPFLDGALDLGVGNLTGSNMFNVVIIVVLDLAQGPGPMLLLVKDNQAFVAAGGILIMALVGAAIACHVPFEALPKPGVATGVIFSVAIVLAFIGITWLLGDRDASQATDDDADEESIASDAAIPSLSHIIISFTVTAIGVVFVSIWLLRVCNVMALRPITLGSETIILGHSFVGSFLLAISTSLPELFVSLAALRLGRVNMSVANIFGSNIMNMSFIPIMHLVSGNAAFYSAISPASLLMLFAATAMSTLFIVGLLIHSRKSFFFLGWEAIAILTVYVSTAYLVFRMRVGA